MTPSAAWPCYDALTGSSEVEGDIDGFNANLDFVLEDETEDNYHGTI